MEWDGDRGLTARIVLGIAIVALAPVVFVYAAVVALNTIGVTILRVLTDGLWRGEFYVEPWLAVVLIAVGFIVQYRAGDRLALRATGARHVVEYNRPDLIERVDRLAQQADVPPPRVAVTDRLATPTAFTVGARPETASIVLSSSLFDTLDDDELDAVIAHELAHIKNRDAGVMTLGVLLPTVTYVLVTSAYGVLKTILAAVTRSARSRTGQGRARGFFLIVGAVIVSLIVTMAISALFWLLSFTMFRVLAKYREFAADRGAAAITGEPGALASALQRLDEEMTRLPDEDLRAADGGVEALYVMPIDDDTFGNDRELISSDLLPETHPPTDERIERLRQLQGEKL
ncbi:MAG: M48 family metalloprotease [Halorhabdus sp.]